jgi:hypothetical protein
MDLNFSSLTVGANRRSPDIDFRPVADSMIAASPVEPRTQNQNPHDGLVRMEKALATTNRMLNGRRQPAHLLFARAL